MLAVVNPGGENQAGPGEAGMTEPGEGRPSRFSRWASTTRRYREKLRSHQERLEKRPWVAFLLESVRRFNKIEGKHLAIVIALNLFIAVIPLIIIGYAFIEAFNP